MSLPSLFRPLIQKSIGGVVRTLLAALGGFLVARAYMSSEDSAKLVLELTPIIATLIWTVYEKMSTQVSMEVAKDLPAGATNAEIKQEVSAMTLPEKVEKALTPAEPPPPVWPPPNEEDDAA